MMKPVNYPLADAIPALIDKLRETRDIADVMGITLLLLMTNRTLLPHDHRVIEYHANRFWSDPTLISIDVFGSDLRFWFHNDDDAVAFWLKLTP